MPIIKVGFSAGFCVFGGCWSVHFQLLGESHLFDGVDKTVRKKTEASSTGCRGSSKNPLAKGANGRERHVSVKVPSLIGSDEPS